MVERLYQITSIKFMRETTCVSCFKTRMNTRRERHPPWLKGFWTVECLMRGHKCVVEYRCYLICFLIKGGRSGGEAVIQWYSKLNQLTMTGNGASVGGFLRW